MMCAVIIIMHMLM